MDFGIRNPFPCGNYTKKRLAPFGTSRHSFQSGVRCQAFLIEESDKFLAAAGLL